MALGEVTDEKYAAAAGAIYYGFPTIADTDIPQILPTGICTYEHVVSSCRSTALSRSASKCAAARSRSPRSRFRWPMARRSRASASAKSRRMSNLAATSTPGFRIRHHPRARSKSKTARSPSSDRTWMTCEAARRCRWRSGWKWRAARCSPTSSRFWNARSIT